MAQNCPSSSSSSSSSSAVDAWTQFISHALSARLPVTKFRSFAVLLRSKHPLPSIRICDLCLRPNDRNGAITVDVRIPEYLVQMAREGDVRVGDVLRALRRWSSWNGANNRGAANQGAADGEDKDAHEGVNQKTPRWKKSWYGEEAVMFGLAKVIGSNGQIPKTEREAVDLIRALMEWARMMADVNLGVTGGEVDESGVDQGLNSEVTAARVALATMIVAASENATVLKALQRECPKIVIKDFSTALAVFPSTIVNASQPLAERIELFRMQTVVPQEPVDKKAQAANDEINQILDSTMSLGIDSIPVVDLPIQNSRAGLYVYLNALLVGRPIVDDSAILSHLHNRYQGDTQSTCVDLISASFDVLANAIFKKESAETTIVLRSFLINKVPLLLSAYSSSMFPPLTPEFCITQALSNVDTNAFPTFSSMFDESSSGNIFGDSVRQDFCFACCLHNLIPEESIERLLGEIPMQTLPAGGRYTKEDLVQQCLADPERTESLLDEIENMDGNVGAASQAITEMINQLCRSKEMMSLKNLCTHLARKPSSLDVLLLFDKPSTVLQPLCELLDSWHHDEDLGEYQPVYEEFGGILLLVMAFVYRYNLSTADLGIQTNDSFVAKWLVRGSLSRKMDEQSDLEKSHLDTWIKGLFNTDGGGLGDEPMSQCPPQDFYLLVPTLFHEIVVACSAGYLNDDSLKGGLEFLVDTTFLLPSLVGAMMWLANHLWENNGNSNAVITILQTLIQPQSISSEASMMLASILNIVAKPLEQSLRYLQRQEPSRQDIAPLSKALASHISFSRTGAAAHLELESWTATQGGGLLASIRSTIQSLIHWSLTPGINIMPTPYTHRQILVGMRIHGAKRVVQTIIEIIEQQTATGSGSVALDVAVAIICAPDPSSPSPQQSLNMMLGNSSTSAYQSLQHRLTLREALKTEAENAPKAHKKNNLMLEATIRLYRRVEAQCMIAAGMGGMELQNQHNGLLDGIGGVVGVDGMQGMGGGQTDLDEAIAAAAAAGGGDIMSMGNLGNMNDGMMDLGGDLLGDMDMKLDF